MKLKFKLIKTLGKIPFLRRLSFYFKDGSSFKIHLITHDDLDEPHSHPWDFSSLIIFGGYYEGKTLYGVGDVNIKFHHQYHQIRLRRFLGFIVPTLTVGFYSEKKQLCSFCQEAGYCLSK